MNSELSNQPNPAKFKILFYRKSPLHDFIIRTLVRAEQLRNDAVFPYTPIQVKKGDAKKSSSHFSRLTLSSYFPTFKFLR